jgi:ankyrin repeat protein
MTLRTLLLGSTLLVGCGGGGSVAADEIFRAPSAAELAAAAAKGDRERVRELVAAGADPNARGDKGVTLTQWALLNRSEAGLDALVEAGADPALADSSGENAIHYAAKANDGRYLDVLLKHKVDPDAPHAVTRATPIVFALMADREEQFRKLLAAGADPNRADRMGNTPLHMAAKINAPDRVLDLLEAGADPAARNRQGATFQRYLDQTPENVLSDDARRGREEIAAWLRKHGAKADGSR